MRIKLLLLVLLTAALAVTGCSPKPSGTGLRWTGAALEGLDFYEREMEQVTIYYTPPTAPEEAEAAGRQVVLRMSDLAQVMGRLGKEERIHLWIVPAGQAWPAGLPPLPPGRSARAVGEYQVVLRQEGIDVKRGGSSLVEAGLLEAMYLSVRPGAGHPAMQPAWVHEGMGGLLVRGWNNFPIPHWEAGEQNPLQAAEAMATLSAKEPADMRQWRQAAQALSAKLVDRFGVHWAERAPDTGPAGLTPAAALAWATASQDPAAAIARWQERIDFVLGDTYTHLGIVGGGSTIYVPTAADISPIRVQPVLPQLPQGTGPNDNYSPHSYAIDARYEPQLRLITGTQSMTWENGEGIPVDTLYFNLWPNAEQYARYGGAIRIESAAVDGRPVAFVADYLDLVVPLGRPVQPGEQVSVRLTFTTQLPGRITMRVFGQEQSGRFNLAHWFPILAPLDDRGWNLHPMPGGAGEPYSENAQFRVRLDVPAGVTVGATGRQVSRVEQAGRWVYEYDAPNVKDWVATGGPGLTEYVLDVHGVKLRVIDSQEQWVREIAETTAMAIPLFTEKFGPYPYPELVVTCCAGLEYPGLFYTSRQDPGEYWKVVTWHELGHQWFYGVVGNDQFSEAWLDEGFTRYAERLAVKAFGPDHLLRDYRQQALPNLLRVTSSSATFHAIDRLAYAPAVYNLAAVALEDLEELLGQAKFEELIREYVRRYQFKTATTADFIALAEEIGGRELAEFFRVRHIVPEDRAPYKPILPPGQMVPLR